MNRIELSRYRFSLLATKKHILRLNSRMIGLSGRLVTLGENGVLFNDYRGIINNYISNLNLFGNVKMTKSQYRTMVNYYTNINDLSVLDNIEKRRFRGWDIDHKISVDYGYRNNISPLLIADISNLRVVTHDENTLKNTNNLVDDSNRWILAYENCRYNSLLVRSQKRIWSRNRQYSVV